MTLPDIPAAEIQSVTVRQALELIKSRRSQSLPNPIFVGLVLVGNPTVHKIKGMRNKERIRREMAARTRAMKELAKRYPDEFAELLVVARGEVKRQRGPLPRQDYWDAWMELRQLVRETREADAR